MQSKWLILIAILIWYFTRKIQAANALLVRYLLPTKIRISKGAVMWDQPVIITNPTGTPINLNRYYIQISLEDSPIGTAYDSLFATLQAASDTTITANVVVPMDALLTSIPTLMNAGAQLDFKLTGNIIAEGLTVPVNTVIRVPIPKLFK